MKNPSPSSRSVVLSLALVLPALVVSAATYLPMSDADLVANAPIVARATVVGTSVEMELVAGVDRPFTVVTLSLTEAIKGSPGATFAVRLPGGLFGGHAWWIPGTPVFTPGQDVVLMLAPHPAHPGQLRLTELGLSKFDIVTDDAGRRFAVRLAFSDAEDLVASKRAAAPGTPAGARDADSFLALLRAAARGDGGAEVAYAAPVRAAAKWVNIGGREPGGGCQDGSGHSIPCLFRWYWDATHTSPNAVLTVNGTQTNLFNDEPNCGTDANCDIQNAAAGWHGVAATDVRLSGPTAGGNIQVNLDATSSQDNGTTWNTALGCPPQGVIGLGGPGDGNGPTSYRNDLNFYAIQDGTVSMRKVTCTNPPYSAATFRSAALHEVGHVMGLGHPDDNGATPPAKVESIHSTTSSDDWDNAVMHSVISTSKPDVPQTDDIQAIQYYYGTAAVGAAPVANFTVTTSSPVAGSPVSFVDASTGGATGWNWNFGEPSSLGNNTSMLQNPSHTYSTAGTYTVTLVAGSLNGSSVTAASKQVTVASGGHPGTCTVDPHTLCLNANRFKTTITWQKTDGTSGDGNGVGLTADSGYFWFFSNTNIESVVKVLNACSVNNHYWVFAAGLTNVQATLTVVDEQTGLEKQYVNPQGTAFAPIQDTAAFATCP